MSDPKQARLLLEAAEEDMNLLRGIVDNPGLTDRIFGNNIQQVAERCLKSWLCLLGETYPFTHDLEVICQRLVGCEADAERFKVLGEFTDYAGDLRYQPTDPTKSIDRESAFVLVEELLEKVQGLAKKTKSTR